MSIAAALGAAQSLSPHSSGVGFEERRVMRTRREYFRSISLLLIVTLTRSLSSRRPTDQMDPKW